MTELLVSILIASVLILTIGVMTTVANNSFKKANFRQSVYNDLSFGFKLLQAKVRVANSIATGNKPAPWISGQHFLINTNATFGLCQYSFSTDQCQSGGSETALVYTDGANQETILRVPAPGTITVSFPALTTTAVTISVSGAKNGVSFSMQTTATRRNL